MKKRERHPIEAIHHIHTKFNALFSWPLYLAGGLTTVLLYVSPYSVRLFLAFGVNLFFNRPAVYLSYFGKFVGKKMNFLVLSILYLAVFGTYALFYRIARIF